MILPFTMSSNGQIMIMRTSICKVVDGVHMLHAPEMPKLVSDDQKAEFAERFAIAVDAFNLYSEILERDQEVIRLVKCLGIEYEFARDLQRIHGRCVDLMRSLDSSFNEAEVFTGIVPVVRMREYLDDDIESYRDWPKDLGIVLKVAMIDARLKDLRAIKELFEYVSQEMSADSSAKQSNLLAV